ILAYVERRGGTAYWIDLRRLDGEVIGSKRAIAEPYIADTVERDLVKARHIHDVWPSQLQAVERQRRGDHSTGGGERARHGAALMAVHAELDSPVKIDQVRRNREAAARRRVEAGAAIRVEPRIVTGNDRIAGIPPVEAHIRRREPDGDAGRGHRSAEY